MTAENPAPDKDTPERKVFTLQIDRTQYEWPEEKITGAQLRQLPPTPIPADRDLFQVVPGHQDRKIKDDDTVEVHDALRFFYSAQHDQSWRHRCEPRYGVALAMTIPQSDIEYLNERGVAHEIVTESGMICVVMPQWKLPSGLDRDATDLLVRLSPGYPDVPPDMWWFYPGSAPSQRQRSPRHRGGRDVSRSPMAALVATLLQRTVAIWS